MDGEALPPGSYVTIAYDAGNSWVLSEGRSARISKAAVDLVDRVDFLPNLTGRINTQTTVYKFFPELRRGKDRSTLEQSEIFANLNPSVHIGDEVNIEAREGDDYIIDVPQQGRPGMGRRGRVPVSAIDIVSGNPNAGAPVFIPTLPQSTDANAPGYVPPPPPPPKKFDDYLVEYGAPFTLLSVTVGIAGAFYRKAVNASTLRPGEADYGVPHANFKYTDDGFKVSFVQSSETFYGLTHGFSTMQHGQGGAFAAIILIFLMLAFIVLLIFWYGVESFFKTVITVDKDSVKIGGKRMPRNDFGTFSVHHSISGAGAEEVAVLGYSFGRRSFSFGGVWSYGAAQEVASALNAHLRAAPMTGDEYVVSPEKLRELRPTDF